MKFIITLLFLIKSEKNSIPKVKKKYVIQSRTFLFLSKIMKFFNLS